MKIRDLHVALLLATGTLYHSSLPAGGFININTTNGNPIKWPGAVTLNLDLGTLGGLTNANAKTAVTNAVARWNTAQIPNCSLNVNIGSDLGSDNANGSAAAPNYNSGVCIDGNPVIYDNQGLLTDSLIGAGANQFVVGFAGIYCTDGAPSAWSIIGKGQAVLNALFIDSPDVAPTNITQSMYEGVITHEIGHMLNLDHAQCGASEAVNVPVTYSPDYSGFPTMYPIVHAGSQSLELDDKAWAAYLYPSATGLTKTKISGSVISNAGANLNGVNIVARSVTNAQTMISCVSGYKDISPNTINNSTNEALYEIPMLDTTSQWVLDFEPIMSSFTGGSRVGPLTSQLNILSTAVPEFISEPLPFGTESNSDSVTQSTTFVPATNLTGINLTLNTLPAAQTGTDLPNTHLFWALNPSAVSPLTFSAGLGQLNVAGSMTGSQVATLSIGGDDIEEWYYVTGNGIEITKVTVTAGTLADPDLFLASFDQFGGNINLMGAGTAVGSDTVEGFFDLANIGTPSANNRLYIGVSDGGSGATGTYTLTIHGNVSDKNAVTVTKPTNVNPTGGTISVTGRGFSNTGGSPTVTFSNAGIQVNSVTYVNSGQLTANVTRLGGFVPFSNTDVTVTNPGAANGFSGRSYSVTAVPVSVSSFSAE